MKISFVIPVLVATWVVVGLPFRIPRTKGGSPRVGSVGGGSSLGGSNDRSSPGGSRGGGGGRLAGGASTLGSVVGQVLPLFPIGAQGSGRNGSGESTSGSGTRITGGGAGVVGGVPGTQTMGGATNTARAVSSAGLADAE